MDAVQITDNSSERDDDEPEEQFDEDGEIGTDPLSDTEKEEEKETLDDQPLESQDDDSYPVPKYDRSPSLSPTDSLAEHVASLNIVTPPRSICDEESAAQTVKERVIKDINKQRTRQNNKYHSKSSARALGRPRGSKAKQSTKAAIGRDGGWD